MLFSVSFKNLTGRDIRAFDGILEFTDLLDNRIIAANVAINDAVPSGERLTWDGELDYNQFLNSHQSLRVADTEDVKVNIEARKILFSNGTTEEYN